MNTTSPILDASDDRFTSLSTTRTQWWESFPQPHPFMPQRFETNYFGITKQNRHAALDGIVNNAVFRLTVNKKNLASQVLKVWRMVVPHYWYQMYGKIVYGFETFVVEDGDRNGVSIVAITGHMWEQPQA